MSRAAGRQHNPRLVWLARFGSAAIIAARPAWAGPPYITDDPEPTRTGGWENYLSVSGTEISGAVTGQADIQLNYGAARDLQLSFDLPEGYALSHGPRAGTGDLNLSAKYRFLHSGDDSWVPDVAAFPAVTLPTGASGFSEGHASLFVPIWVEKDFGKYATFGGGGYHLHPGAGERNYGLFGWAVTRGVSERLNLGFELYHQTPSASSGPALTNLGVGAIYQMSKRWALMASGGPGLEGPSHAGRSTFYISMQFTN